MIPIDILYSHFARYLYADSETSGPFYDPNKIYSYDDQPSHKCPIKHPRPNQTNLWGKEQTKVDPPERLGKMGKDRMGSGWGAFWEIVNVKLDI